MCSVFFGEGQIIVLWSYNNHQSCKYVLMYSYESYAQNSKPSHYMFENDSTLGIFFFF